MMVWSAPLGSPHTLIPVVLMPLTSAPKKMLVTIKLLKASMISSTLAIMLIVPIRLNIVVLISAMLLVLLALLSVMLAVCFLVLVSDNERMCYNERQTCSHH